MTSIAIESVVIDREARQRRVLTDAAIKSLMESIAKVGLINPILIDENDVLVAGECRLTACTRLGWSHIPYTRKEDCSPDILYLIELEENVRRTDLAWQDECRAVAAYHDLRLRMDSSWTAASTATELSISPTEVYHRRNVHAALEEGNELVCKADRYSTARGIVSRANARKTDSESELLDDMMGGASEPESPLADLVFEDSGAAELIPAPTTKLPELSTKRAPFLNASFIEWQETYEGKKFNFIHCDFPYGVDAGNHNSGAAKHFGGYDDAEDVYWDLLECLGHSMHNVVAESAHMMFWFSMDYYSRTKEILELMGWTVNAFPLIWHKNDNSGIMPDPKRGPRRIYETAFLCSRGDRLVVQPVANTFSNANTKLIHMSEKPQPMLAHFFRMFVDKNTTMLDPTMGSGNAVRVAETAGAARFLGLEMNEGFYDSACAAYAGDDSECMF